jgi:hypothetical protein
MAYPLTTKTFTLKIDKNASGYAVGPEYFNVPAVSPYTIYLDHVPKDSASTVVGASGGAAWTEVLTPPTSAGHYMVDYVTGKLTFHSGNSGTAAGATYKSLGDDIMAEHVNSLQDEVVIIEDTIGENPQGPYNTIQLRLNGIDTAIAASGINGNRLVDNTVRSGALMDDIKGSSWVTVGKPTLESNYTNLISHIGATVDAHDASAISCLPPGAGTFDTVQEHISAVGTAVVSSTNPHGMALADIPIEDISIPGNIYAGTELRGGNVYGNYIFASGAAIFLNHPGPDKDQSIYFYNNSIITDKYLRWRDGSSRFELNSDIYAFGNVTASGNFLPEASGTRSCGTQALAFSEGNFGTLRSDNVYLTNIYGRGTGLSHSTLTDLPWSRAGHTIDANIIPTASGTQSVGTAAVSLGSGNFDVVQAVSYKTGASVGANGSFTSANGKTITVKNGLIVSIV